MQARSAPDRYEAISPVCDLTSEADSAIVIAMKRLLLVTLLLAGCATAPAAAPPAVPDWDVIPGAVLDGLCKRLTMDGVASGGSVAIVSTTQPLITSRSMASLSRGEKPVRLVAPPDDNKIQVMASGGACNWQLIESVDRDRNFDRMVVELSQPVANPFSRTDAGLFARVSLGGEHPAWYWIPLSPRGGGWTSGFVAVLPPE